MRGPLKKKINWGRRGRTETGTDRDQIFTSSRQWGHGYHIAAKKPHLNIVRAIARFSPGSADLHPRNENTYNGLSPPRRKRNGPPLQPGPRPDHVRTGRGFTPNKAPPPSFPIRLGSPYHHQPTLSDPAPPSPAPASWEAAAPVRRRRRIWRWPRRRPR